MIMAVGLTVSKVGKGQRSEGSGHSEIDYSLQLAKVQLKTTYTGTTELECLLNGLP